MTEPGDVHPSASSATPTPRRVLHLVPTLDIGGLERVVHALCREQRRLGVDARVLVIGRETGQLAPLFAADGIPVIFCPKGRGFSLSLVLRIHRELRAGGITLLHSHDLGALIYASFVKMLRLGRVHLVHTQHSFAHLAWHLRYRLYERVFPAFADRIVCVSESLRDTYRKWGQPAARLAVIPNGADFGAPAARADAQERRRLLAAHRLPEALAEKKWIVCLGRFALLKGHDHLLEAWNLVDERLARNAALIFVGPENEPGLEAKLRASVKREAWFAGATLEPDRWLRATDLFVSASEFEGLPMACLEAAAARLPMLLSEIPGHELFRGWAAFFPLGEASAAARGIERFLRTGSPGEASGNAEALERIAAASGTAKMAERYLRVYDEAEREITSSPPAP